VWIIPAFLYWQSAGSGKEIQFNLAISFATSSQSSGKISQITCCDTSMRFKEAYQFKYPALTNLAGIDLGEPIALCSKMFCVFNFSSEQFVAGLHKYRMVNAEWVGRGLSIGYLTKMCNQLLSHL
jgi:hypothetical protein